MKLLSRIHDERTHYVILALTVFAAFAVRLAVMFHTVDIPWDGPARATKAHNWSMSPYFETHGGSWLPGDMYVVGIFDLLFQNSLLSARLLHVILGSLTVLAFYMLIRKVYDSMTALMSASILAFFPLHIGLSASGLTEASFAFEVISGTLCFIMASETDAQRKRAAYLVLALFFLGLAVLTRYEAWVLIPLFPTYYFWKRRRVLASVSIMVILSLFPLMWSLSGYLLKEPPPSGVILAGANHVAEPAKLPPAIRLFNVPQSAHLLPAIKRVARASVYHLGWLVPVLAMAGIALQCSQAVRRTIDAKKMLYGMITCFFWAGVFAYSLARRPELSHAKDRYFLFAFITALPFSILPLTYYFRRHTQQLVMVILMTAAVFFSVIYKPGAYRSLNKPRTHFFVTLRQPVEIKKLAEWLKNSPYRESPLIMTHIQGQSAYLSLYFPEAGPRRTTVKDTVGHSAIEKFVASEKPCLLITYDGDSKVRSRIGDLLGTKIGENMLVHTEEFIKVYEIKSQGKKPDKQQRRD